MKRINWLFPLLLLPLAAPAADAPAAKPANAENCVSLPRIDRTRIVDDNTIIFYMKGGDIYVNHLPRRCPGLRVADSYLYKTSLAELCNVDTITVLQRFGGPGFTPGPMCGLGYFEPVTPEQAKALLAEPGKAEPKPVNPGTEPPAD